MCCTRIDARQAPGHTGNLVGRRQIAFGEQQAVSHRHLTNGVEMAPELAIRVPDIDRRDDSADTKALGDEKVFAQGLTHGGRDRRDPWFRSAGARKREFRGASGA